RRAPDPLAAFEVGVKAYVQFGLKHRTLYALMFEQDAKYAETAAASADAYGVLIGVLSGLGIQDPLRVGFVLWTAHHGLVDILCRNFDLGGVPKQAEARVEL